jgi:hypothetical protein
MPAVGTASGASNTSMLTVRTRLENMRDIEMTPE